MEGPIQSVDPLNPRSLELEYSTIKDERDARKLLVNGGRERKREMKWTKREVEQRITIMKGYFEESE